MARACAEGGKVKEEYIAVFITTPSLQAARKIAQALLEERIVACANIMQGVLSLFRWEGKIDDAEEVMVICKTVRSLFPKVIESVRKRHEYKVPEIIAVPIIGGNPDYLKWINESTVE